jgi:hypothetical protein
MLCETIDPPNSVRKFSIGTNSSESVCAMALYDPVLFGVDGAGPRRQRPRDECRQRNDGQHAQISDKAHRLVFGAPHHKLWSQADAFWIAEWE